MGVVSIASLLAPSQTTNTAKPKTAPSKPLEESAETYSRTGGDTAASEGPDLAPPSIASERKPRESGPPESDNDGSWAVGRGNPIGDKEVHDDEGPKQHQDAKHYELIRPALITKPVSPETASRIGFIITTPDQPQTRAQGTVTTSESSRHYCNESCTFHRSAPLEGHHCISKTRDGGASYNEMSKDSSPWNQNDQNSETDSSVDDATVEDKAVDDEDAESRAKGTGVKKLRAKIPRRCGYCPKTFKTWGGHNKHERKCKPQMCPEGGCPYSSNGAMEFQMRLHLHIEHHLKVPRFLGKWSKEENQRLISLSQRQRSGEEHAWEQVASDMPGRDINACKTQHSNLVKLHRQYNVSTVMITDSSGLSNCYTALLHNCRVSIYVLATAWARYIQLRSPRDDPNDDRPPSWWLKDIRYDTSISRLMLSDATKLVHHMLLVVIQDKQVLSVDELETAAQEALRGKSEFHEKTIKPLGELIKLARSHQKFLRGKTKENYQVEVQIQKTSTNMGYLSSFEVEQQEQLNEPINNLNLCENPRSSFGSDVGVANDQAEEIREMPDDLESQTFTEVEDRPNSEEFVSAKGSKKRGPDQLPCSPLPPTAKRQRSAAPSDRTVGRLDKWRTEDEAYEADLRGAISLLICSPIQDESLTNWRNDLLSIDEPDVIILAKKVIEGFELHASVFRHRVEQRQEREQNIALVKQLME